MEYYDREKVLYLADPFRRCGVDAIKEHNLKAKLLPETEAASLIQEIILKFTDKKHYPSLLWEQICRSQLWCQDPNKAYAKNITFDEVFNINEYEWLASFYAEPPFILWSSYNWIKTVFVCEDVFFLIKIMEATCTSELYISNYNTDFIITLHDKRYLSAYGQVAIDWLQGHIDEYNKTK